jgi:hypothetical protein
MANRTRNLSGKKKIAFYCIVLLIPPTTIFAIYIVYTGYRTRPLYSYIKSNQRGWRGKVHKADAELGFAPVPDSQGAEVIPAGSDIPARYDKDGFRGPLEDNKRTSLNQHPIVLTLGCSFTYGAAVSAEDAYAYLVGHYLGGTERNAGVGSYGLSQMMILAKRLVPTYKPDYLLVQYSPWLVSRAQNPFAPANFGKLPTPYFFVRQNELVLHPPVFRTEILDLPIDRYRNTPVSVMDKVSFLWNVGLPLFVHDDLNMSSYNINSLLGRVPEPATNPEQITKYVYEEIAKVARENGAKLVIVVLGNDYRPVQIPEGSFPTDSILVNAHDALLRHLPVANQETYQQSYAHWRGSPLRIVDFHPNETAHKIIAEAIVQKIQDDSKTGPDARSRTGTQ